ncbi:MAG: hypothetical protein SPD90_13740 [Intestinibacter sp.]|uniref:hypothetical protein n=2 Tax=Intestinibacter sp. TaxID=1965304 RepID=UPI002A8110BB|nr:hypothetical protein [Intestinibacter sp.]MDY4576106.1 hypothetical protein [Intestinibacter sp.]
MEDSRNILKRILKNKDYDKDYIFYELKKESIDILTGKLEITEGWMEKLKKILNNGKNISVESKIVFSLTMNKELNLNDQIGSYKKTDLLSKLQELNFSIINEIYDEIYFNIDGKSLYNAIFRLYTPIDFRKKIKALEKKLNNLTKIILEENRNCKQKIIEVEFENINERETLLYNYDFENYYYFYDLKYEIYDLFKQEKLNYQPFHKNVYGPEVLYLINNKSISIEDIDTEYERVLLYGFAYEISSGRIKINAKDIDSNAINSLIHYKKLFKPKYFDEILNRLDLHDKRDLIEISDINDLIYKISIAQSEDEIFSLLKSSKKLINLDDNIDIYVYAISKSYELNKNSIKIALFCEELLNKKPIIYSNIINYLKLIYKNGIYTQNTLDTIKYIEAISGEDLSIDELRLKINFEEGNFSENFLESLVKVYNKNKNKNFLDPYINKIINTEEINLNHDCIYIIYKFYKKYNDIKALDRLCKYMYKNQLSLNKYNITIKDIEYLISFYEFNEVNIDKRYLLFLMSYCEKFEEKAIDILMDICKELEASGLKEYDDEIFHYINLYKSKSDYVYIQYVKQLCLLPLDKLSQENISELTELFLEDKLLNINIQVIENIIKYNIKISNNIEAVKCIYKYLNSHKEIGNNDLIKKILIEENNNIEFIECMLKYLNLNDVENIDFILNIIAQQLFKFEKYSSILDIFKFYINREQYTQCYNILIEFIKNVNEIDEVNYESIILNIIRYLDKDKQINIYNSLIERNDLPIEIREEFYQLNTCEDNKYVIINAFEEDKTASTLAKYITLDYYKNNDDKFKEIAKKYAFDDDENSSYDQKIYEVIYNKIKSKFKNDKYYVEDLLHNIKEKDDKLIKIEEYIDTFMDEEFDEQHSIYGEYLVVNRKDGEVCEKLYLKNIFDNNQLNSILFKDNDIENIINDYFNKININYTYYQSNEYEYPINLYILKENELFDFNMPNLFSNIINNLLELIKLQKNLISNGKMIKSFTEDSFFIFKNGFIPSDFTDIVEFEEDSITRDLPKQYMNYNLDKKGNYYILNQKNIIIIIKQYIKIILLNIKKQVDDTKLIDKFIGNIVNDNTIISLNNLIERIIKFLNIENKAIEDLTYKERLNKFEDLSDKDKKSLMDDIVDRGDITITAKRIILDNYSNDIANFGYFKYLLSCINDYRSDLDQKDLLDIYEKLNSNIDKFTSDELDSISVEIENMYIIVREKVKIKIQDIKRDVERINLSEDTKGYIIRKIEQIKPSV